MDLLKILTRYRTEADPKLMKYDEKCISTFSKDDLLQVSKNIGFKVDDVLVLGDIDDTRENLCKLLSFALEQKTNDEDPSQDTPPQKKKKSW